MKPGLPESNARTERNDTLMNNTYRSMNSLEGNR
jgi:hypothetical protein